MPATVIDLPVEQGATFRARIPWRPKLADGTYGDPINMTGYTGRMQARRAQGSPTLVTLTTENGGLALGADGIIDVYLSPAQTNQLVAPTCLYDLEVVAPNTDVYRVCKGKVLVDPNITQDADDPIVTA